MISHDYFPTKQMLFVQLYFACLACLPLSVAVSCPAKPGGASIHLRECHIAWCHKYIYICMYYIYICIYISIYMNAYQRHALEDPVEECRATHPIAWCWPHPDGFGTCILGEKVSKIHWWKLVSTHQLSHFSMAIPGGSRVFTFSDTPTCAMRDSNPQEVTCSFSPPPKEKVIKTSTENHLKQHFSSRFPGSIYSLS